MTNQLSAQRLTTKAMSAKFVVAGGFGVGKTTYVGAVSDIPPLRTEEIMTEAASAQDDASMVSTKQSTTVAMDFGRIPVGDDLMIYLFGTPGQARFAFMWETIVQGALGAIVLVDPRRVDECFAAIDYFEQRKVPFVVAQNRFPGTAPFPEAEFRELLALNASVPLTVVNALDTESVKSTLLFLIDYLMQQLALNQRRNQMRRSDLGRA